jgi:hypothetical protein
MDKDVFDHDGSSSFCSPERQRSTFPGGRR